MHDNRYSEEKLRESVDRYLSRPLVEGLEEGLEGYGRRVNRRQWHLRILATAVLLVAVGIMSFAVLVDPDATRFSRGSDGEQVSIAIQHVLNQG